MERVGEGGGLMNGDNARRILERLTQGSCRPVQFITELKIPRQSVIRTLKELSGRWIARLPGRDDGYQILPEGRERLERLLHPPKYDLENLPAESIAECALHRMDQVVHYVKLIRNSGSVRGIGRFAYEFPKLIARSGPMTLKAAISVLSGSEPTDIQVKRARRIAYKLIQANLITVDKIDVYSLVEENLPVVAAAKEYV